MKDQWNDLDRAAKLAASVDDYKGAGQALRASGPQIAAGAAMVNRTRRVVRERARTMQVRKSRMRSLYIPLLVSAGLLAAVMFALWTVLEGYDATGAGVPAASQQIMVMLMWYLPVSAALLAAVWVRRTGSTLDHPTGNGRPQ
jgi:uncharacterized membrane protein YedE/YeeE